MNTNTDRRDFIKAPTRLIAFSVITQFVGMNLLTTSDLHAEEDAECYKVEGVSIFKKHSTDADCTPQPSTPVPGADYNDNDCGLVVGAPGGAFWLGDYFSDDDCQVKSGVSGIPNGQAGADGDCGKVSSVGNGSLPTTYHEDNDCMTRSNGSLPNDPGDSTPNY